MPAVAPSVCRIGFTQNVPSELKDIMADDKNFSVIASNVITVEKRVKELWFDVIPTSEEKLLEGRGCGLGVRSCIASVRPLESAGKPQQVDGVPIHPINFSLLLPTLSWCAAATAVVNHVTLSLHDIRTRLRRGQAGWDRTSILKDSKAPNPFTTLLQLSPSQFHQDVLSYITQPVAGMSSGRVSVQDPKQVAQMHFRLNPRHYALLSSDCMNCIYDVEGAGSSGEVGSGNDSGVSTTSSAAVASQAKKIAIATLKDVINLGHPKFGHYIPSCTPLLVSTAQSALYDVPSYNSLLFHKHNVATVERIRWIHYDRLIRMLSVVVGQPQADQLLNDGVSKHGRRIKASYRECYVLGKTPPKSAESDEDDAEHNDAESENTTTSRPPPVVSGAKRERAHNEHGIEEFIDVDEEESISSPVGGGGMVAQSIRDLPFDVKMDWSPLLANNITDDVYQASVDAVTANMSNPDEQTKQLIALASNHGGSTASSTIGPQHIFDARVSHKALSCIGVVADIQRTLLESSNLLGITQFISSPLYKVDPHAPLMVSGILEARHPMDDPLHPLAHYVAFSGTASPVSSSCGVKHSHRPSRIVDIHTAATRDFMKSAQKERFEQLHERLSIFTDLVKRKLEQFEGVMQCIGPAMRPAKTRSSTTTTTASSSAASTSSGWMSVVVEALPYHPYAIPAHPTQRTLHLEVKNMSVDAAQEVLHWLQRNHFIATVLQSLMFHAEEWAIQLRIALREGQELAALKSG